MKLLKLLGLMIVLPVAVLVETLWPEKPRDYDAPQWPR